MMILKGIPNAMCAKAPFWFKYFPTQYTCNIVNLEKKKKVRQSIMKFKMLFFFFAHLLRSQYYNLILFQVTVKIKA